MNLSTSAGSSDRRLLELHAATCRTLAHPTRLALIEALREGERSVGELVRTVGTTAANVSQHLTAMRAAGVLRVRRERRYAFYRIGDRRILTAFRLMREVLLARLTRDAQLAERPTIRQGRLPARAASHR
ncbi:MAG TPA: metalloregulator ArsR/SmtB family transcription factor [Gemmatimonadales bacterium]